MASLGLATSTSAASLEARLDEGTGTITIHRDGLAKPLVTQHAAADHRPYLHPIVGPDGNGVLTEYISRHHKNQTGMYWDLTRVNGRDYFHHPADNYWGRKGVKVLEARGESVKWETVYDLLDADGNAVLTETNRSDGFAVLRVFRPDETYEPVVRDFIDRVECASTPL